MNPKIRLKNTTPDQVRGINWDNAIIIIALHLGAVAALFMWSWQAMIAAVALYWLSGSPGIGMGFHRLMTHRGYVVPKPVEYVLAVLGTLTLQGGPIDWVVTHRIHHACTDSEGDPHSPRDGFWWSHIGWVLKGRAQQHPKEVISRYAPDLAGDRFHVWLDRLYYLPIILLAIGLVVFGGWGVMMWGVFLRVTVQLHTTWFVNSASHLWGRRRFLTTDDSRNTWWVAILTFGEGWHNNHHAHPRAARHGLAWYEIDFNYWGIWVLRLTGLARRVKLVRLPERSDRMEPAG